MNKKLLSSLLVVGLAATALGVGTRAYFSDTEESTGNVLAAGSIDLKVDNHSYYDGLECKNVEEGVWQWSYNGNEPLTDPYLKGLVGTACTTSWSATDLDGQLFFDFADLKPGDWGEDTISLRVDNNDSYLCADVTYTSSQENTLTEPELKLSDTQDTGELQKYVQFAWWADDGDNVLENDEALLGENVYTLGEATIGEPITLALADSQNNIWTNEAGPVPGEEVKYIGKAWCFGDMTLAPVEQGDNDPSVNPGIVCSGAGDQNDAQSDSVTLDVVFTAVQSRNNEGFVCQPEKELTLNSGEPRLDEGYGSARFRSFANTGGQELYLGHDDLGTAGNRAGAQEYTYSSGETPVLFSYDAGTDTLSAKVGSNPVLNYAGVSADTCPVADWDTLKLTIANRDTGTTVNLNDLTVNGTTLGNLTSASGWNFWSVTGADFGSGFDLSGNLELGGTFSTSQENSKLQLDVGCGN